MNLADILHAVLERCEQMNGEWNHFDSDGNAVMVDVSGKNVTVRTASAQGKIKVNQEILEAVAQQTWSLIPMCHPLCIRKCTIDFRLDYEELAIYATSVVKVEEKTGVEMEALTAVTVALLTIYDMCKAIDKRMEISEVHLLTKTGGKSGDFSYD